MEGVAIEMNVDVQATAAGHLPSEDSTRPSAAPPMRITSESITTPLPSVASEPLDVLGSGVLATKPQHSKDGSDGATATAMAPESTAAAVILAASDPDCPQLPAAAPVQQQQQVPTPAGLDTIGLHSQPLGGVATSTEGKETFPVKRKVGRPPKMPRPVGAAGPSAGPESGPPVDELKSGGRRKKSKPVSTAPFAGSPSGPPIKRGPGRPPKASLARARAKAALQARVIPGQPSKKLVQPIRARPLRGSTSEDTGDGPESSRHAGQDPAAGRGTAEKEGMIAAKRRGRVPKRFEEADAGAALLGLGPSLATHAGEHGVPAMTGVPRRKRGRPSAADLAARAAAEAGGRAQGGGKVGRPRKHPPANDQPGGKVAAPRAQRARPGVPSDPPTDPSDQVKRKFKVVSEIGSSEGVAAVPTAKRSKVAGQMLAGSFAPAAWQSAAPLAPDMDVACFSSICTTMGSALESETLGDSVRKESLWQVAQHALGESKLPADQDRFGAADAWLAGSSPEAVEHHWKRVLAYVRKGVPRALMQHLRIAIDEYLQERAGRGSRV